MIASNNCSKIHNMAQRFLKYKITPADVIVCSENNPIWQPYMVCNDYYPKLILNEDFNEDFTKAVIFEQRDEFEIFNALGDQVVVQPRINGWGVSFENVRVFYKDKKYILNLPIRERRNTTFDDQFYRFNDMYTFEERGSAQEGYKEEYLKKSWTY